MEEGDSSEPVISVERALDLFFQEQYEDCIEALKYYTDKGNMEACSSLGSAYYLGLGVSIDIETAIKYLSKAANSGLGVAAHNLGTLYATAEIDIERSRYWFDLARKLGFHPSKPKRSGPE